LLRDWLRRQTLSSFDYQWGQIPDGDAMLSDPRFVADVERILSRELLGIRPEWFRDRRALDAGCGGGRWTLGLLRLGCQVTAVDFSAAALASTARRMAELAPQGRLVTRRVDLLEPPTELGEQSFDLVYSFGVLHHTGDTRRALANVAALVKDDGVLFVYLYGRRSAPLHKRAVLLAARAALAPLPFSAKRAVLARLLPGRDTHQAFDLLSPTINDTLEHATVEAWLRELGFTEVARTLDHEELFLRASRPGCSARPFLEAAPRPYWFERFRPGS
jgi:SAM-dependent methyltransferase